MDVELIFWTFQEVTEEDIKAIKGQKVVKKFGKKKYGGEVTDFDPETKWFKVSELLRICIFHLFMLKRLLH